MYKNNKKDNYQKAIEFMQEKLFEKVYVTEIAEHCGMSASGLEKIFKRHQSPGVMRYFLDLKLEYTAMKLKEGKTVNYLAEILKFSSSAHLSMAFKKKYGISPQKYKYSKEITD